MSGSASGRAYSSTRRNRKLKPLDLMAVIRQYVTGCTVIYVDRAMLYDLRDVDVRLVVGIEVCHNNSEAPPEFHNPIDSEHRCGTIVVWRRN